MNKKIVYDTLMLRRLNSSIIDKRELCLLVIALENCTDGEELDFPEEAVLSPVLEKKLAKQALLVENVYTEKIRSNNCKLKLLMSLFGEYDQASALNQ